MNKFVKYGSLAAAGRRSFHLRRQSRRQMVMHNQENAKAPFASSVMVPPATTCISSAARPGRAPTPPSRPPPPWPASRRRLAKQGLTFGDVVQAHVFLVGDPAKGGKMDFAGMNSSWFKEFGTAEQPNKPARAAFQVAALAGSDAIWSRSNSSRSKRPTDFLTS